LHALQAPPFGSIAQQFSDASLAAMKLTRLNPVSRRNLRMPFAVSWAAAKADVDGVFLHAIGAISLRSPTYFAGRIARNHAIDIRLRHCFGRVVHRKAPAIPACLPD
jgi:hypothetical protein